MGHGQSSDGVCFVKGCNAMTRWSVVGAIGVAIWAGGPAAAQSAQWQSLTDDGACVAQYAPGEGVSNRPTRKFGGATYALGETSVRLTRKFGGATTLTYAFVTSSHAFVGDGDFEEERFVYDISIAQPPKQTVNITAIFLNPYDEATAYNPDARIIVSIAMTDALLAWIVAEKPGYTILYDGKIVREIRFPDLARAQRLVAACTPTIREVNRLPKPIGRRERWFRIDRMVDAELEGLSGTRRVVMGLTVGTDGQVQRCGAKASTGSTAADANLCAQLTRNGRFEPATDGTGQLVTGTYDFSFFLEL